MSVSRVMHYPAVILKYSIANQSNFLCLSAAMVTYNVTRNFFSNSLYIPFLTGGIAFLLLKCRTLAIRNEMLSQQNNELTEQYLRLLGIEKKIKEQYFEKLSSLFSNDFQRNFSHIIRGILRKKIDGQSAFFLESQQARSSEVKEILSLCNVDIEAFENFLKTNPSYEDRVL